MADVKVIGTGRIAYNLHDTADSDVSRQAFHLAREGRKGTGCKLQMADKFASVICTSDVNKLIK